MNKTRISILIMMVFLVLIPVTVSAETAAKVSLESVILSGGTPIWSQSQFDVVVGTPAAMGDLTISLISATSTSGTLYVVGSQNSAWNPLTLGATACIKGNCSSSPKIVGDMQIRLVSTYTQVTATPTPTPTPTPTGTATPNPTDNMTTSEYSPVYAYLDVDKQLKLNVNDTQTFDPKTYFQTSGWTTSKALEELKVVFDRKDPAVPVGITLSTSVSEPKTYTSATRKMYVLTQDGTYTFTVTYKQKDGWGYEQDKAIYYTLVATGLKGSSSSSGTSGLSVATPIKAEVGKSITITMTAPGTWEAKAGVTISPAGTTDAAFMFDAPGKYELVYAGTNGGKVTQVFDVAPAASVVVTPNGEVPPDETTANQNQGTDEGGDWVIPLVIIIAIVGIIGFLWMRKGRGGSGKKKFEMHPESQ